jgi:hypothetical protein
MKPIEEHFSSILKLLTPTVPKNENVKWKVDYTQKNMAFVTT